MSKQAETFIAAWLGKTRIPQECDRRRVLKVLAEKHLEGPLRIDTQALAKWAGLRIVTLWFVLFDLHRRGAIDARDIGQTMTVTFPFDFPPNHPAYVNVSPDKAQEAAE